MLRVIGRSDGGFADRITARYRRIARRSRWPQLVFLLRMPRLMESRPIVFVRSHHAYPLSSRPASLFVTLNLQMAFLLSPRTGQAYMALASKGSHALPSSLWFDTTHPSTRQTHPQHREPLIRRRAQGEAFLLRQSMRMPSLAWRETLAGMSQGTSIMGQQARNPTSDDFRGQVFVPGSADRWPPLFLIPPAVVRIPKHGSVAAIPRRRPPTTTVISAPFSFIPIGRRKTRLTKWATKAFPGELSFVLQQAQGERSFLRQPVTLHRLAWLETFVGTTERTIVTLQQAQGLMRDSFPIQVLSKKKAPSRPPRSLTGLGSLDLVMGRSADQEGETIVLRQPAVKWGEPQSLKTSVLDAVAGPRHYKPAKRQMGRHERTTSVISEPFPFIPGGRLGTYTYKRIIAQSPSEDERHLKFGPTSVTSLSTRRGGRRSATESAFVTSLRECYVSRALPHAICLPPFALSVSKGKQKVFRQPVEVHRLAGLETFAAVSPRAIVRPWQVQGQMSGSLPRQLFADVSAPSHLPLSLRLPVVAQGSEQGRVSGIPRQRPPLTWRELSETVTSRPADQHAKVIHQAPPVAERIPVAQVARGTAPGIDLDRLAAQVHEMIERKFRIERTQRGL